MCQMRQIYSNHYFPDTFGNMEWNSSNPSKIRHSRGSLWPWCEADWEATWQPSPPKMSSYFPVFRNVLAGCGRVVFSVSSLPAGMAWRDKKSQLIRTTLAPWKQELSDVRDLCFDQPMVDERMWSPACTAKSEWSYSCELFPDVTCA